MWEVERLLDECSELPQVLLLENVPQIISKSNGNLENFQSWRRKLESLGYSNYVQLLNAKDYGIPQNRNRCFMVSILGEYHYTFPKKKKLELKLKDLLEDKVDEKYYLSDDVVRSFVINSKKNDLAGIDFERERERVVEESATLNMEQESINRMLSTEQTDCAEHSKVNLKPRTRSRYLRGGSYRKEQVNTNPTKSTPQTEMLERLMQQSTNTQCLSKTVRSGGRGSLDRHTWDLINEEDLRTCEEEIWNKSE